MVTSSSRLVSVIVPCYNQARFLGQAVDSVLRQTYRSIEVVVVDDGSTDDTSVVAASYAGKVRYLYRENRGLAASRNAGVAVSTGDYLQFLDADDLLEPDKIHYQLEYLLSHPDIDIVYGEVRYFSSEDPTSRSFDLIGEENEAWVRKRWDAQGDLLTKLIRGNLFPVNCALLRRGVVAAVGPWNERMGALEDWEYWIRCAAAGLRFQFKEQKDGLALVRIHGTSMSHDKRRMAEALFALRLSAGRLVNDPHFRLLNYRAGLDLLQFGRDSFQLDKRLRRFVTLTHAHATVHAYIYVYAWVLFASGLLRFGVWRLLRRIRSVLGQPQPSVN